MEKEKQFNSPTQGLLNFNRVISELIKFMEEEPNKRYSLVIGTDSKMNGFGKEKKVDFVTAIVLHRLGVGGRYFWTRTSKEKIFTLRQKIYEEANLSLTLAQELLERLKRYLEKKPCQYDLEIHIDIGENGETREMIKEVVGFIRGNGFQTKIKPYAYGASKVADRHV